MRGNPIHPPRKTTMNKDQIQGIARNIVGFAQEKAGKLLGSREQEIRGIRKQVTGRADRLVGDTRASIKNAPHAI
jgi:uncharacterized protein YjbJ (UPF0337 family)